MEILKKIRVLHETPCSGHLEKFVVLEANYPCHILVFRDVRPQSLQLWHGPAPTRGDRPKNKTIIIPSSATPITTKNFSPLRPLLLKTIPPKANLPSIPDPKKLKSSYVTFHVYGDLKSVISTRLLGKKEGFYSKIIHHGSPLTSGSE